MESVGAARTSGLHIYSLDPGLCPLGLEEGLVARKEQDGGQVTCSPGHMGCLPRLAHISKKARMAQEGSAGNTSHYDPLQVTKPQQQLPFPRDVLLG